MLEPQFKSKPKHHNSSSNTSTNAGSSGDLEGTNQVVEIKTKKDTSIEIGGSKEIEDDPLIASFKNARKE